jgi:hypothetical protein
VVVANSNLLSTKALRGAAIAVFAILIFWGGGFFAFTKSDDWSKLQETILLYRPVTDVVGDVHQINPKIWKFSHSSRGDQTGNVVIRIVVTGSKSSNNFLLFATKRNGRWTIDRIES